MSNEPGSNGAGWSAAPAAGVVLVGGRSERMGTAKAELDWHGTTLLYRTAAVLARGVAGPVVVVAAPGQRLGALPAGVAVATDPVPGRGPLQGLATGLAAVADRAPAAFVCATDLPFLHPAFVRRVLALLAASDAEVLLPVVHGFAQPLAAGYRTALAGPLHALLEGGERRLGRLGRHRAVRTADADALLADPELAAVDPGLDSVVNVNTPADYAAARRRPPPAVRVTVSGGAGRAVPAATLDEVAAALGRALPPDTPVRLNDRRTPADPRLPLVAGDQLDLG